MAPAASESAFFFMSCAPRLSEIVGAFLRSAIITSADEVTASTGASPCTTTVSVNPLILRLTSASTGREPATTSTVITRSW